MPQQDRNDEDFWTRSRRTSKSDKRSKRGRKRNDGGGGEIDWTEPDMPSSAPPRGRRGQAPPEPAAPPPRTLSPRVAAAQRPPADDPRPPRGADPRRGAPEAPPARGPFLNEPTLGGTAGAPPPLPSRGTARRGLGAGAAPGAAPVPARTAPPRQAPAPVAGRGRGREPEGDWVDPSSTNRPHLSSRTPGAGAPLDPGAPGASGRRQAGGGDPGAPGASGRRRTGSRPTSRFETGAAGSGSTRRLGDLEAAPRPSSSSSASTTGGRQLSGLDSGAPAGQTLRGGGERRSARPPAGLETGPTGRRDSGGRDAAGRREPLLDPGAPGASGRRQAGARPQGGAATGAMGAVGRDDPLSSLPGPGAGSGVRRPTGESPALADRLEGLAARATPPRGMSASTAGPRPRDPMGDPRSESRREPPPDLPPTAPVPVARPSSRTAPGPGPAHIPAPAPRPSRQPGYEPPFEAPYDDDAYRDEPYDDTYGDEPYDDFEEDEPVAPERRSGCGKPVLVLAAIGVVMVLVMLMASLWVRGQIDPGGQPGDPVRIEIVAGQSTSEIGKLLEDEGIITSASVWSWYVRLKGGGDIQAGVYEIPTNLSMGEALDELAQKPLPPGTKRVTVPEGQTITQIRERVTVSDLKVEGFTPEGFDAALADPAVRSKYLPAGQNNLEGTFYPETYDLTEDGDELELLQKMRDQLDTTMDDLGVTAGAEAMGRTPYEILIVASIIEEEAKIDEDRPKVARVIYNRLANDEALYIDAINCYEKGEVPCRLSDADFERDTPYNSRKTRGLPPTPIAAPREASIAAALQPAEGDWTFYVLDPQLGEGHHLFTNDIDEFNAAKDRCSDAGLGCG